QELSAVHPNEGQPLSSADIDRRRGRLLGYLALLLAAFAGLAVALTQLGPELLDTLHVAPWAARFGILALTGALVALVWERERELTRLAKLGERQRSLVTAFRNRLEVLESLLEAGDRLNAPLMVPDVLEVLLDAAIELAGAEGGTVTATASEDDDGDVVIARRHSTSVEPGSVPEGDFLDLPLISSGRRVGMLVLAKPFRQDDAITEQVLRQFAQRAAIALDRAQLVAQERASIAYLRAANLVKGRFLQTVSHELRTPLTSIMGYARTLERHWDRLDDEAKIECARAVSDQGGKLSILVERILDAAKVELEGVTVRRVNHDVRRSVARGIKRFEESYEGRIQVALPTHAVEGEVDPFVVEQAVVNLVDNALRYTEGPVSVSLDHYKSTIEITVRDEGPGMDAARLKLATRPLYGLDDVRSGTGLGLHIVHTLVTDHLGKLEIRSQESGTTAVVSLPRTARRRDQIAPANVL
ncbi:MAG: GAF domain-containing sensor histidine kinase, partial [Gaiellales bacterium]